MEAGRANWAERVPPGYGRGLEPRAMGFGPLPSARPWQTGASRHTPMEYDTLPVN